MQRIEKLETILDSHIESLLHRGTPILNDSKMLMELLKATQLIGNLKREYGVPSEFDNLSVEELEKTFYENEEDVEESA